MGKAQDDSLAAAAEQALWLISIPICIGLRSLETSLYIHNILT